MLNFGDKVTYKMFCSTWNEDGTNCTNEAVGEIATYPWNNGGEPMYLPICQEHLDKHKPIV